MFSRSALVLLAATAGTAYAGHCKVYEFDTFGNDFPVEDGYKISGYKGELGPFKVLPKGYEELRIYDTTPKANGNDPDLEVDTFRTT
jgi:hypothetical protein